MKKILLIGLILNSFILSAQTKVIAHRGFSSAAPENTMAAFQKAIDVNADCFELDVRKTKDDSLIVIHDATVDRTSSNGFKGKVSELNYSELTKARVGYTEKFGDKFKDEKIPTLREALMLAKGKIKVCIEMKVYGVEDEVYQLLKELNMINDVIIFSFHCPVLIKFHHLDKNIKTLYLFNYADKTSIDYARIIESDYIGVGYDTKVTPELVSYAHKNNLELWKWTVDKEEDMKELMNLHIDGIITNFPDVALKIRNNRK